MKSYEFFNIGFNRNICPENVILALVPVCQGSVHNLSSTLSFQLVWNLSLDSEQVGRIADKPQ